MALTAREGVAAHLDGTGGDRLAVGRSQHVGVERNEAQRHPRSGTRRAVLRQQPVGDVLEIAPPRPRSDLDPLEPLDAARTDVAGHHHAQRRAMDRRERLAVHPPREQDLRAARLVERDRAAETLGRLRLRAEVGTLEADVGGFGQRSGEREHVRERDAGPGRGAGRPWPPRRLARDVADGDQARTPVAGALQRRGHLALPERLAQRREGELQLPLDDAQHAQPPRGRVDLRHRAMAPHVEGVCGGHRTLGQRGEPGLGVERLLPVNDHAGALSVATHGTNLRVGAALERHEAIGRSGRAAARRRTPVAADEALEARRRRLPPLRVEWRAADRAARGVRSNPLAAPGTPVRVMEDHRVEARNRASRRPKPLTARISPAENASEQDPAGALLAAPVCA